MKSIAMVGCVLICMGDIYAQSKQEELLDKAISDYGINLREEAMSLVNAIISKHPDFARAYFIKANWLITARDYVEAQNSLVKLDQIDPNFNPLQKKMLAQCYFESEQYEKALMAIDQFARTDLNPDNKAFCKSMIQNIQFIRSQPKESNKLKFQNLGTEINTDESEYFPSTTADESSIYFTRKTRGNEDIWISYHRDGSWTPAVPIDEPLIEGIDRVVSINSYDNDGAHTISPTGRFLFFTSCNRPKSFGSCDLFFSKRTGNEWGKPSILAPPINTGAWETQPCISADGKYLYFVSNREGGMGRADIYLSKINDNGSFTNPENLGPEINTPGNEDRPFIHPDGKTLYFSSDGHPGYGLRDIFMSKKVDGKWTTPINLGNQINSSGDESAIFINALGTRAYMSKQNLDKSGRDYDIYSFDLPEKYQPDRVTYIKGLVTNAKTNQPLKASVKVENLEKNEPYMSISSDEKTGDFLLTLVTDREYGFDVLKEGYAFYSKNYSFKNAIDNKPQTLEIKLWPLEAGTKFELRNVFFETGEYALKPESGAELNYIVDILTKNPNIRIQISGHTDNVGQAASNQLLSENRAKSVMDYLISKGIQAPRLTAKGYGSTKPISTNETEEGRALNRRTEVEVL